MGNKLEDVAAVLAALEDQVGRLCAFAKSENPTSRATAYQHLFQKAMVEVGRLPDVEPDIAILRKRELAIPAEAAKECDKLIQALRTALERKGFRVF